MKFVYFIKQPLSLRDRARFGIECAINRGHAVTVFDLTDMLHPSARGSQENIENGGIEIVMVRDWKHFQAQKQIIAKSDLAFLLIQSYGLALNSLIPLRMLTACKTPYLVLAPALYPGWSFKIKNQPVWDYLKDLWERCRKMNLANSIIARLPPRMMGVSMAAFLVKRDDSSIRYNSLVGSQTAVIEAHTDDYDLFLQEKKRTVEPKNQAVFIDQYLPFHVDFQELGASKIDANAYYGGLRLLFDRLEREFGIQVIIAAHPRAKYDEMQDFFGERQLVYGQTTRLIAESRLVMTHHSTAIGLAVLFNKPVMLLTSLELYNCHVYEKCIYDSLAEELGTPLRYFDDPKTMNLEDMFTVNSRLYDRYIETYLKCRNSPSVPYWENVMATIEAALNPKDRRLDS